MCGLAGFFESSAGRSSEQLNGIAHKMTDAIRHRGPDDSGVWMDQELGVVLGFRRLAILDLSSEGHQPMLSACGRYVLSFNGEIYNHKQMRKEVEESGRFPYLMRGHSDTEVVLAAMTLWGVEPVVRRCNGMFSMALWDRKERRLHLMRDRLGEKPMYYGWSGKSFLFGSELKALKQHPAFSGEIDRDALALFFRHNYIPTPYTIYRGIQKLPPGAMLTLDERGKAEISHYWSAKDVVEKALADPFTGGDEEAIEVLDRLLYDAVKIRMEADVPLGAFLSGGVDSSTIVALMQKASSRPVKTFTIGFEERQYDEAIYAKKVAAHLGTDHTELYVTPQEAMDVIPRLPVLFDEPFADSSQIPTFLVSSLAKKSVTVSLSGDGGDELFSGYNRYVWGRTLWSQTGWMPKSMKDFTAGVLTSVSPEKWQSVFESVSPYLPKRLRVSSPGDKLHKLAEILAVRDGADNAEGMYYRMVSHWKNPKTIVKGAAEPSTLLTDRSQWANIPDFVQRMMFLDLVTYLPDDILTKVDRASMGESLEARVPLLDPRVVEFAWRLPMRFKVRNGQGKWLLRRVLDRHVPRHLIERPKMGFGLPIDSWLRGPLKHWAEDLLDPKRMKEEGFLNPAPIRQKWEEHLSGQRNWQHYLWDVFMFQAWLRNARE